MQELLVASEVISQQKYANAPKVEVAYVRIGTCPTVGWKTGNAQH